MSHPHAKLPVEFVFEGWQDLNLGPNVVVVVSVLERVKKICGTIPFSLESEKELRAFSDAALIPLADLDVEPTLVFPHPFYATREWVKTLWLEFVGWCQQVGWLVTPSVPPSEIPEQKVSVPLPIDQKVKAEAEPTKDEFVGPPAPATEGEQNLDSEFNVKNLFENAAPPVVAANAPAEEQSPAGGESTQKAKVKRK